MYNSKKIITSALILSSMLGLSTFANDDASKYSNSLAIVNENPTLDAFKNVISIEDKYYEEFKKQYSSDILNWNFEKINKQIESYYNDYKYLIEQDVKWNLEISQIYLTKYKVLEKIKEEFENMSDTWKTVLLEKYKTQNLNKIETKEKVSEKYIENKTQKINQKREDYKEKFRTTIQNKLEKPIREMKQERLISIKTKIENIILKYEQNTKITENKKESAIAQFEIVIEMINKLIIKDEDELIDFSEILN